MNNINFLDVLSEHWSINPEQVSSMRVYESSIYLYINDAEEPSIRIECENEKVALSFFTLWKMRINDSKKKTKKGTQMTDKEPIMIDGVDVSRCKYLPYCNDKQGNCAFDPNCYFKQHARKTQEYNELALQIRGTQEYSDTCAECKDDIFTNARTSYSQIEVESRALEKIISRLKSKTQECEQIQEKYEALKLENQEGYEIVAELKKECEELNKLVQQAKDAPICFQCEQEPCIRQKKEKFEKALEEIETATKINCEEICGRKFADCNDTSCFSADILDIISRAKGEE